MIKFIGVYDYTVILTYISLFSAIFGMIQAMEENFHVSVFCLLLSGICDAFDGTVARTKKDRTEDEKNFGIQLDSLCDAISFGIFPAFLSYYMGVNGTIGLLIVFFYCLCGVIRLAFFNVLEAKRQKEEGGCNKTYRGLPITSSSIILPIVYVVTLFMDRASFAALLHVVLVVVGFLFILDFSVPKPDMKKVLVGLHLMKE